MSLKKVRVYSVDDGDGHSDVMDEYSKHGDGYYYYVFDVDPEIARLRAVLHTIVNMDPGKRDPATILAMNALAES